MEKSSVLQPTETSTAGEALLSSDEKPRFPIGRKRRCGVIVRLLPLLMLICSLPAPVFAKAAESNRFVSHEDTVSLVSEADSVSGATLTLGLLFRLSNGWHIYWKDAGDAGSPPQLTLKTPDHTTVSAFAWPAPDWLVANSLGDYVVSGTVLLPFAVALPQPVPAQGAHVQGVAHWLVCSAAICVPQQASFTLHLPAGPARSLTTAPLFAAARAAEPSPSTFETRVSPSGGLVVEGRGLTNVDVRGAHFFPDRADAIVNAAPQRLVFKSGGFSLALKPLKWTPSEPLNGVLEITDPAGATRAFTLAVPVAAAHSAAQEGGHAWLWAALAALIGGLLLNLMPCVFPVLAIKAFGIMRLGGEAGSSVRAQSLAYTAGVVATMLIIGAVLESLRAAGAKLGWGFQLQSPAFVTFIAWLVFGIGLNFAGMFEFGSRFAGVGAALVARGGLAGSFVTGLVAVAVATPCTAPFMGAAIAAALAAAPLLGFAIFFLLGVGMALPFLVVGFFPHLGRFLPRPGQWMVVFRQLMAFPMFGTAVWLLWVVAQQAGATGILIALTGATLLTLALWLLKFRGWLPVTLRLTAGVGALVLLPLVTPSRAQGERSAADVVPYSAASLANLREEGRPVLIDMSAAWCVTCLVNERIALNASAVRKDLRSHHVVVMMGDWTNRDPAITRYLEAQHRDGVPLYVYYPPDHRAPVVLPQLLTPSLVESALRGDVG
jgi:thiol:disulfide interchange protein